MKKIEETVSHKLIDKLGNKAFPIYEGVIKYFPDAIREVAHLSLVANEQHHPEKELHWDKSKSTDDLDAMMRHLCQWASGQTFDDDGIMHMAKVAWRALAAFQRYYDKARANMINLEDDLDEIKSIAPWDIYCDELSIKDKE